ncbi:hypothetical protein [Kitasatospora saccharophila]|uniref:hypothetical protein n=1 Tax=Kitasatospora saccharophila TaxID=407973 RepID=UPI0031DE086A
MEADLNRYRSVRIAGRTVAAVDTAAEYARLAAKAEDDHTPIPVLNTAWDQFLASLAMYDALHAAPAQPEESWRGVVFAADAEYAPVAQLLARCTGRELQEGSLEQAISAAATTPVTIVAGPRLVTPQMLAVLPPDAPIGLLTARTLASASALVARTILFGPLVAAAMGDLSFDALADENERPGRLAGLDATPRALNDALGSGVAVMAGRGHARDCLMHLNGGGICGRSSTGEPAPRAAVPVQIGTDWSANPAACQQSDRCWRDDVLPTNHLRAAEVRGAFVVLDSCRTAQIGEGSIATDVSLPLAFLEGSAVAVACAVGTRGGLPEASQLFTALVRSGLSLGDALAEVNGAIAADPSALGRLGLFGDAGLVPLAGASVERVTSAAQVVEVTAGPGAVLADSALLLPANATGPLAVPRRDGQSCWLLTQAAGRAGGKVVEGPGNSAELWSQRIRPWLDRLRSLTSMGLTSDQQRLDGIHRQAVAALRAHGQACTVQDAEQADADFAAAVAELTDMQVGIVERETDWIRRNFYSFTENWPEPWSTQSEAEPSRCPQCGITALLRHRIRPAAGAGAELCYHVCVRCGEIASGAEELSGLVVTDGPAQVRCGESFPFRVTVTAPPHSHVSVAVGASFQQEERFHCSMAESHSFELSPGEARSVEFTGSTSAGLTIADQLPIKIFIAVDGAVGCLTRWVWLRA